MKIDLANVVVNIVENDNGWVVEAIWKDYRIGYAFCSLIENAEITICDLVVESDMPVRITFAKKFLNALGLPFSNENFQGNGVGSLLLNKIILESKRRGIKLIWGSVVQKDINRNPFLLGWYERLGFSILAPDEKCLQNAVKKIQLEINYG